MDDEETRAILADSADAVCRLDRDGRILKFIAGTGIVGGAPDRVGGRRIDEVLSPSEAAKVLDGIARCLATNAPVSVEHLRVAPSGLRNMRARISPGSDGNVIAHVIDVTAETETRAALAESLDRYRLLARATSDAIYDWDVTTDRVTWNERLASTFGHPPAEAKNVAWWLEHVHPDDIEHVRASAATAMRDPTRDIWAAEYRFRTADGRSKTVSDRALLLRKDDGRVVRVIGSLLDVTEQRAVAARLAIADRLVLLGSLAAGVAHDVTTPLNYVVASTAVALERARALGPSAEALLEGLADVERGATQLAGVIGGLRAMVRDVERPRGAVDVASVVRTALGMIDAKVRAGVDIVVDAPAPVFVDGHPTQLGQVVTNLVVNALEALDGRAAPRVEVTVARRGDLVLLEVTDNGRGIDVDVLARVFDPFFTTKQTKGGSGLGLAVTHAIVTRHEGTIGVRSDARGTSFHVSLPVGRCGVAHAAASPDDATARARILVVDDDELTRRLVAHILGTEHDVVVVGDAQAALAAARASLFDVVLSDYTMPETSGAELHAALREYPAAFAFLTAEAAIAGDAPCLRKPFTADALRAFVRTVQRGRATERVSG